MKLIIAVTTVALLAGCGSAPKTQAQKPQYCYTNQTIVTQNGDRVNSRTTVECSDDQVKRLTVARVGIGSNCGYFNGWMKKVEPMFNTVRSVASCLMVVGKLLILTASSPSLANDLENPRFFNYSSAAWSNRLADLTFGWFKTLDDEQKIAYNQAIHHAVMYADNGEVVRWYKKDASGMAMASATWPSGAGYCRRLHVQAIAYNVEKTMRATACFNDVDNRWTWSN